MSIVANVAEVIDLQNETPPLMEEIDNVLAEKIKKTEELKPYWEPSDFQAHFCQKYLYLNVVFVVFVAFCNFFPGSPT